MEAVAVPDLLHAVGSCVGGEVLVVDLGQGQDEPPPPGLTEALATTPAVLVGVTGTTAPRPTDSPPAALAATAPDTSSRTATPDATTPAPRHRTARRDLTDPSDRTTTPDPRHRTARRDLTDPSDRTTAPDPRHRTAGREVTDPDDRDVVAPQPGGRTGGGDVLPEPGGLAAALDVVVSGPDAAAEVVDAVRANPLASAALVLLLRGGGKRSVGAGLVAESATYSTLQAGPEHTRWLAAHTRRARPPEERPAVRVERTGDRLVLTLDRPHVRNAFDARTRDHLLDGLAIAAADGTITEVILTGAGPSFCSGGDLDEFGTFADPASAHLLRLARSAGRAVAALADRVVARVHGACVGAGVELPAFAGRVVAAPDTTFRLPEVAMGLVPGAGGTVSLPRRIGRHRTAWLALTGRTIDAPTALTWGLVDEISPRSPS